jgi:TetR/AcrR family transcriptional repressor of nem operon
MRSLHFKTTGRIVPSMARTDKQQTRQKLLDRGVAMLTEHGYHGTGLQELLAGVQVPKGSFYNYFASKEEFAAEAIGHYLEPFIRQLDDVLGRPELDALSALQRYFGNLIEELERRNYKGGCLLGNLIGEIGDTNDTCLAALRAAVHRYRDKLQEGLARGQREGTVRADLSAEAMADLLCDGWQGALLRMKVEQSVRPLERFVGCTLDGYFRAGEGNRASGQSSLSPLGEGQGEGVETGFLPYENPVLG